MNQIVLVLDAMGVIYTAADDVAELLIPFIRKHGGSADDEAVAWNYTRASLGEIDADAFWRNVGLSAELEEKYLAAHGLTAGLTEFLGTLPPRVSSVWCLSNDVGRWSRILRERRQLERYFAGFVISGDTGSRKPAPAIYQALLERTQQPPHAHLFVDDRVKNLDAARSLGFQTACFRPEPAGPEAECAHDCVRTFSELRELLNRTA